MEVIPATVLHRVAMIGTVALLLRTAIQPPEAKAKVEAKASARVEKEKASWGVAKGKEERVTLTAVHGNLLLSKTPALPLPMRPAFHNNRGVQVEKGNAWAKKLPLPALV